MAKTKYPDISAEDLLIESFVPNISADLGEHFGLRITHIPSGIRYEDIGTREGKLRNQLIMRIQRDLRKKEREKCKSKT